jgi:drug/metabolite transporter (DMT)-like permease
MNTNDRPTEFNPLIVLVFGAFCIGFAPVFVKLVGEDRLGPTAIGFWRTLFGAVALFLLAVFRGSRPVLPTRLLKFSVLAGFIFFVDLFVWHRSVMYCGAGMSTILGNTQVFITAIVSFFLFRERLSVRFFLAAISALAGVMLLTGLFADEVVFTPRYIEGVFYGLATALAYASYLITLRGAGRAEPIPDVVVFMAWTSLFSALFLGLSSWIESAPMLPPDTASWIYLISLGLVAQALGWWVISWSLARIATARAGLILLLQPALAMLWGVVMFSEQFTLTQAVGATITLTAIYFGGLRRQT